MILYKILLFPFKHFINTCHFFFSKIEFYFKNFLKTKIKVAIPPANFLFETNTKTIAIFAIYQPKGLSYLLKRSISYLIDNGVQLLVVAPHSLTKEETDYLREKKCIVLTRKNIGRDFGSYKYGVLYLLANLDLLKHYEKILLVNDSIIFPLKDHEKNLEKILELPHKVVGLAETFEGKWHIGSYFILFKKEIFLQKKMLDFWRAYMPYNSRLHAINKGEIGLSKVIRELTDDYSIIYNGEKLIKILKEHNQLSVNLLSNGSRKLNALQFKPTNEFLLRDICHLIESSSPAHMLGLFLIEYMDCFFIKKDICFRNSYPLSYVVNYISQINNNLEFLASLSNEFKNKKIFVSLGRFEKILYYCGII